MQIIDVVVEAIIYRAWLWIFFGNFLCLVFFKTYYCCCVNNYVVIISFNARLKKMYENIDPRHVFDYFNYSLNETITEKFSSITIAKCICYIMTKVVGHKNFKCRCFQCQVCKSLVNTFVKRKRMKLLLVINNKNFETISFEELMDSYNMWGNI